MSAATGTFRSLRAFNYRTWALGAIVSNVGTWMQRTAQDWIVLTQLTSNNATAVGVVMALQFGPRSRSVGRRSARPSWAGSATRSAPGGPSASAPPAA